MSFNKDINGYKNEEGFANYLNNKSYGQVNPIFQDLLQEIYKSSVCAEGLNTFIEFLNKNKVLNDLINQTLIYHYTDGTIIGSVIIKISNKEYRMYNQEDVDLVDETLNTEEFVDKAID